MSQIRLASLGILAALLAGCIGGHQSAGDRESSSLEGDWEIVSVQRDGQADARQVGARMTFTDDTVVFAPNVVDAVDGLSWTFTLTEPREAQLRTSHYQLAAGDPAQIDLRTEYAENPTTLQTSGIYSLQGDTLTYCISAPDQARPAAFTSAKGDGCTLVVLKRLPRQHEIGD